MGHSVVIVESPAKARTLGRYLGSGYTVKASMGHVVDLPAKSMGIDIEADFKPEYVVIPNREATLRELKKAIKGAEKVFLAPDPDREGEAIAYHLKEHLGIAKKKLFRVTFNEITKRAVEEAFKTPGQIDMDLVNAQQARRIMDRLVGYKLSPLLWEKITQGLSAGRVQSVAVRLIAEREKEIEAFRSEEYWKVAAVLGAEGAEEEARFLTELKKIDGKAAKIADGDEAEAVRLGMMVQHFAVVSVTEKERKDSAKAPLNTSLLQQQGSIRLRFSAKKTMMVAQQLYEGIELGDQGPVGLITYMRTDSYHIAKEALQGVRDFIASTMGKDWLSEKPNVFKARKGAQAAHEAIRPTDVTRTPDSLKSFLKRDQLRLYSLIWERFVACQMAPARWAVTTFRSGAAASSSPATCGSGATRTGAPATGGSRSPGTRNFPSSPRANRSICTRFTSTSTSPSPHRASPRRPWSRFSRRRGSGGRAPTPRSSPPSRAGATSSFGRGDSSPRRSA
jgi:DNA topoisomerase-1